MLSDIFCYTNDRIFGNYYAPECLKLVTRKIVNFRSCISTAHSDIVRMLLVLHDVSCGSLDCNFCVSCKQVLIILWIDVWLMHHWVLWVSCIMQDRYSDSTNFWLSAVHHQVAVPVDRFRNFLFSNNNYKLEQFL